MFTAKSGIDAEREIIRGRPYGGVAILWHKSITDRISVVNVENRRLCAITFQLTPTFKILMASAYFPCDNYMKTHVDLEYAECIEQLEYVIIKSDCNAVIIAGDLNTDFSRNVAHTNALKDFVNRNNLHFSCHHSSAKVKYTYESFCASNMSHIDHFICSSNVYNWICNVDVIENALNNSNHKPLLLNFKYDDSVTSSTIRSKSKQTHTCWQKATPLQIREYQKLLNNFLEEKFDLSQTVVCNNVGCLEGAHLRQIEHLCKCIVNSCLDAANLTIPQSKPRQGNVPYWTEQVQPERDKALYWHYIWVQAGKPRHGWVANIMRSTRVKYHRAIKLVKKQEEDLRKQRMAQYISENNSRDLWGELKRLRVSNKVSSNVIDGYSNEHDICEVFKKKYETLLSDVPSTQEELSQIQSDITSRVYQNPICSFNVKDIEKVIGKLKSGKADGNIGFCSDHIINSSKKCQIYISLLFNSMLMHGYCPGDLLISNIVSIPKNPQGSLSSSENYRGISLSNALTKVLDLIIIEKCSNALKSSNLQYGFK